MEEAPLELAFGMGAIIAIFCLAVWIGVDSLLDRWRNNTACPNCGEENTKSVINNFGCWKCGQGKP